MLSTSTGINCEEKITKNVIIKRRPICLNRLISLSLIGDLDSDTSLNKLAIVNRISIAITD